MPGERDPIATTRLNAFGTAAVFAASESAGVSRVIYATSISAVGHTTGAVGDDTRLAPGNVYGATKAFCEHLAFAMSARARMRRRISACASATCTGPGACAAGATCSN